MCRQDTLARLTRGFVAFRLLLSASLWFCPKTSGLKLRSQDGSGAVD
jgi:hypothetical protein